MLRLDPKEAPGRASTQEHFPRGESSSQLHHRETAGQLQARPQGHLWHCSLSDLPDFQHIWTTSRRSWKLPARFSCE